LRPCGRCRGSASCSPKWPSTRALGDGAEFRLLSDVLRASSNSATYDEIFREILDYDENVRDLLLQNPEDETVFERQREQERIAGEELQAAVLKMRYDACCDRLDRLARQSTFTPEELTELTELNQQRTDMKRRLGL
jgi:DNA primase